MRYILIRKKDRTGHGDKIKEEVHYGYSHHNGLHGNNDTYLHQGYRAYTGCQKKKQIVNRLIFTNAIIRGSDDNREMSSLTSYNSRH